MRLSEVKRVSYSSKFCWILCKYSRKSSADSVLRLLCMTFALSMGYFLEAVSTEQHTVDEYIFSNDVLWQRLDCENGYYNHLCRMSTIKLQLNVVRVSRVDPLYSPSLAQFRPLLMPAALVRHCVDVIINRQGAIFKVFPVDFETLFLCFFRVN